MARATGYNGKFSFSWQIVALISFGIIILAVIGSLAASFFINRQLSELAIEQGRQITSTLAHKSILPLLSGVAESAREDLVSTLHYSNVKGAAIFDRDGQPLITGGNGLPVKITRGDAAAKPFEPMLSGEGESYWIFTAAVYDTDLSGASESSGVNDIYQQPPELLGYVGVLIDRTSLYKIQEQLLRDSLLVFIGMALLLMVLAAIFSRQLTRPLYQLAGLMKRAEDGEEGIRAALDGPLEIHDMARAFNTMMAALEQRQAYAEQQHDSLLREVEERQLIEQALRDSEHRLVSIFNNVVDGILILDDGGNIESVNPVAASMLRSAGPLPGRGFDEVIDQLLLGHEGERAVMAGNLIDYCAGGCHLSIEREGARLEMDVKFSVMDIKGARKYIAIIRDITETEQQKSRIVSLLAQHEAIVSSVPGMIMELDRSGKVLWCNKYAEQVLGYLAVELHHSEIFRFVVESGREALVNSIGSAFAEGKTELHLELLTPGGITSYQFNMARMEASVAGESTLLLIGLDDSESVMAQRAMQRARDAALESARIKSEFLANMSHEIRTPMNGMFGMLQLLSSCDLNEEQHSYAEIALRSADQLLHIINDILDFSKIEAGRLELERVEMSPRSVIEDVVELFSQRAHAKGVGLYSKVVDVPDIIYGDPTRLSQIISNLIGNAVKFTDRGHILVTCSIGREGAGLFNGARLFIAVADTGIGIEEAAQGRIFESFIQADGSSTRRYSGTGLGLAIVKQLVELMGGTVTLQSTPGKGSLFTISIPLLVPDDGAKSLAAPMIRDYRRACYIGDDPIQASVLDGYLKSCGYTLESVEADRIGAMGVERSGCTLYLIDYVPQQSEALIEQLSQYGAGALLVVMVNQDEKPNLGDASPTNLRRLVKPLRYQALRSAVVEGDVDNVTIAAAEAVPSVTVAAPGEVDQVRLLVVEDNETNLRVINSMLGKLGYVAASAQNGQAALELMSRQQFDIILMDCQMPVMDGYQTTAAIRRSEGAGDRAVIIAMTGNAMEGDRERCLVAGMDDYISKPVRLTLLAESLSKWSAKCRQRLPAE